MAATDGTGSGTGNGTGFWQRSLRWPWRRAAAPLTDESLQRARPGEMPGVSVGGFPLVRTFAHGAMGELHLATDPASGLPLAIKTVRFAGSELTRQRFLRESAAAARLQHPGIVATYAAGVDGGGDTAMGWIAMEWVAGHDLSRYIEVQRLLPEPLVLDIVARAADALAHAHAHGVVHRDIKPANILVNLAAGVVKVSDFGCAHLSDAERSRSGLLVGSPAYMAPEQLAGTPLDGRCDIYALAVVLYQLLTGRLPFDSASMGELLTQIANHPAPLLAERRPELPPLLSDIVARGLAKQADLRQADAAQLARELRMVAATWPANPESPGATAREAQ